MVHNACASSLGAGSHNFFKKKPLEGTVGSYMARCPRISVFVLSWLFFLGANAALAQQNTADIVGTVSDSSGASIPGATVTLTNTGTNVSQTTTTSATGDYTFTLVQVGSYSVRVESKGFKTVVTPVSVSAGDRTRVDQTMQVGDVTQTVEVSGSVTPALQTDTSTLGTLVTTQAVEDVPLNGRNITTLLTLSVGATSGQGNPAFQLIGGQRPDDRRQSSALSINGQDEALNNNLIDGLDNNERVIGGNVVRPSVDAIQEVNVSTNMYDATVGRTAGGVVDVITKSGGNDFHGSAYEFFRNRVLNTNPGYGFPTSQTTVSAVLPKPAFRQNQYGASLGGPIRNGKTFFFADFEALSTAAAIAGASGTISVPTACERGTTLVGLQAAAEHVMVPSATCGTAGVPSSTGDGTTPANPGDFSDIAAISQLAGSGTSCTTVNNSANITAGIVNGVSAGCPYVIVPNGSITKQGLEYFSMFPLPNGPGTFNNYTATPLGTQNSKIVDTRIDQHFSDTDTLFGRFTVNNVITVTPQDFPAVDIDPNTGMVAAAGVKGVTVIPGGGGPGFPGTARERQQNYALSYVHVFRPTLLINLKAEYLRSSIGSFGVNNGTDVSNLLFPPCTSASCVNPAGQTTATGLEAVTLTPNQATAGPVVNPTYTGFGDSAFLPELEYDNTFEYSGAITWTKGAQTIKIGVALIRRRTTISQSRSPNGSLPFTGQFAGVPAADLLEGLSAGSPNGGLLRSYEIVSPGYRMWEPGAYVQDDWRAKHWLTLNLGIRYDIFTPFVEKRGRISNYDEATGLIVGPSIPGAQQTGPTAGIKADYLDIAPRFGFAATLKHDFVVRGGFGLTFWPVNYQSGYNLINTPFVSNFSCALQEENSSQIPCSGQFEAIEGSSPAVAQYGAPSSSASSSVGQSGGYAFTAGLPVPVLNVNNVFAPSAAQCSLDPSGTVKNYGSATGPCPKATDPYQTYNSIGNDVPFNFPAAYMEQMNLQVEKAFGQNVIAVGEVTELSRRLQRGLGLNVLSNYHQILGGFAAPPLAAAFPWLANTTITENANTATGAYNALQATFVRRFSKGLTAQFNYTWSHNLTNFVSAGGNSSQCTPTIGSTLASPTLTTDDPCLYDNSASPSNPFVQSWYNKGPYGWGNSTYDIADKFGWTFNYQVPFGNSLTGVAGEVLKGWGLNAAGSWQTGSPFQVTQPNFNLTGIGVAGLPDQICSGRLASPTKLQWFNPACFESQAEGGTFGDEHPNQLFGPPQRRLDFSIFKEFPLKENLHLQFRTEVFNLFNTPNFEPPSSTVAYSGNGTTCTPAAANGAAAATRCTGLENFFGSGTITSLNTGANSRQIQFALKLLF
jgi:Carboxypeptidase regulatory-like domain